MNNTHSYDMLLMIISSHSLYNYDASNFLLFYSVVILNRKPFYCEGRNWNWFSRDREKGDPNYKCILPTQKNILRNLQTHELYVVTI